MPSTLPLRSRRTPDRHGRRALVGVIAGALAGATVALVPAPAQAGEASPSDITMVQANLKSDTPVEKFQADVREVLAEEPDFVTYNEVPLRNDAVLAPEGYALHRSKRNRYTAATAVAWREDEWAAVDQGTYRISSYDKIPPGRNIKLGVRFANWVTLRSDDGRQVSVVAIHIAPPADGMPDLLRHSVRRLNGLVGTLAPGGPVLVGGDFNVHYRGPRYPRDLLEESRMVPTYDTLGTWFPTHRDSTIDYVFNRGADVIEAEQHRDFDTYSDHDAVVAGLGWQVDAPGDTQQLVTSPDGSSRRQAVAAIADAVRAADAGSEIELVTSGFELRTVFRRLKAAADRGVHVRLTTRSEERTRRERRLARYLARSGDTRSAVRPCRDACLTSWRESGMARSFVLVRGPRGRARLRIDANRVLNDAMLERRTRLVTRTGEIALSEGEEQLASVY